MPHIASGYRLITMRDQKWVEHDGKHIPKRDSILETFFDKFKNKTPWVAKNFGDTDEGVTVRN